MNARPLLLPTIVLLLAATPALAQPPGPPRGQGGPMMGALQNPVTFLLERSEELSLDAEQTAAMKVLADSLDLLSEPDMAKLQAARASGDRSALQGLRPVMQSLRSRNDAFVERAKAVLTEEQKPVADTLLAEHMPRRRGRPGGGGGLGGR